jgi:hypothetical protein
VTQSFTADRSPRIVVEVFNGRGGGVSQAAAEDDLQNVEVTMTQDGDTIRVVANDPGATLELHTNNGPIEIRQGR